MSDERVREVGPSQDNRVTRLARVATPILLVVGVSGPAATAVLAFGLGLPDNAVAVVGLWLLLAFARIVFAAPPALVRRALAGRPALDDLLPADLWAALLVLPVATSAVSALSSAAITLGSLTLGDQAVLSDEWRLYAALLITLAGLLAVVVPVGAAHRTVRQRADEEVRIFDDAVPDDRFQDALDRQWAALAERPRWWLSQARLRALGTATSPPARAWPSAWRGSGASRSVAPATLTAALIGACLAGAALAAIETLPDQIRLAGLFAVLVALPALTAVVDAYRVLLTEQSRARVLRDAGLRRQNLIAQRGPELGAPRPTRSAPQQEELARVPRLVLLKASLSRRTLAKPSQAPDIQPTG